eukprot:3932685-Rhodomonas_salina.5
MLLCDRSVQRYATPGTEIGQPSFPFPCFDHNAPGHVPLSTYARARRCPVLGNVRYCLCQCAYMLLPLGTDASAKLQPPSYLPGLPPLCCYHAVLAYPVGCYTAQY